MKAPLIVAVLFAFAPAAPLRAASEPRPASPEQIGAANLVLENTGAKKQMMSAAAASAPTAPPRQQLVRASIVSAPTEQSPEREIVEMLHFDYSDGRTVRSRVDLTNKKVLKVERLAAYPTPLAEEELRKAISLARDLAPAVNALYQEDTAKVKVEPLVPTIADPNDPRFGRRIVDLNFRLERKNARVSVDLTTGTIVAPPPPRVKPTGLLAPPSENIDPDKPVLALVTMPPDDARTIEQWFPAGAQPKDRRSAWRIFWQVAPHNSSGEILSIREAWFKRSPDDAWIKVLGDARLAEIFVPYNAGQPRYYDVALTFPLATLAPADLGPNCVAPGKILEEKVAFEVHDKHLAWMDDEGRSQRAEEAQLWAVYDAGNYRYIMHYGFRDDGSVDFQLGATAHNLKDLTDDSVTHLHTGCWRVAVELGRSSETDIHEVRYVTQTQAPGEVVTVESLVHKENGIVWKPEEFTRLRVRSKRLKNGHRNPDNYIAYDVLPHRGGAVRTFGVGEQWTSCDFWVTQPADADGYPQWAYPEVHTYAADEQPLAGKSKVIWHAAGLVHRIRDEDMGSDGYDSYAGVALTAWAGFSLKPRNLFPATPGYPQK